MNLLRRLICLFRGHEPGLIHAYGPDNLVCRGCVYCGAHVVKTER